MAEEWDVFQMLPGDDAPVLLATLYEANQKTIRVERDGTGSGSFAVNRSSPECTETILAQGNLVRVRIPEIHTDYLFAFFLETGDFTLISSQEEGGEMLTFAGRGMLSYLNYAQAWSESYIDGGEDPIAGVWRAYNAGTGAAPGQILRRLLEEFQDPDRPQQPIPHLTIDFDYDDDSSGDPWDETDATDEFSYQVGERGLTIVERLLETDAIRVQMDPDFLLHAWNVDQFGRDLTGAAFGAGVVRFERGVNIATELRRQLESGQSSLDGGGGVPDTHMLSQGEADKYGTAALGDAATRVTKEGFIAAFGTGTTALNGIARAELRTRLKRSDTIMFQIANRRTSDVVLVEPVSVGSPLGPVATDGFYLPGPEGTLGDFWVGDTVRVHTGTGPWDYDEVNAVVTAITISRDDDNAELIVIPELKTVPPGPPCPDPTPAGFYGPIASPPYTTDVRNPLTPADGGGVTYYLRGGLTHPIAPSPGFVNDVHFPAEGPWYTRVDGDMPGGYADFWSPGLGNFCRLLFVGDGTATLHFTYSTFSSGIPQTTALVKAGYIDALGDFHSTVVFNELLTEAQHLEVVLDGSTNGSCINCIDIESSATGINFFGWGGVDWTPA